MDVLIEIHDNDDWNKIRSYHKIECLGINSRNLEDFSVDISRAMDLKKNIQLSLNIQKSPPIWVAESGLSTPEDLKKVCDQGFDSALIGTSLMQSSDPEKKLKNNLKSLNNLNKKDTL